MNTHRLHRYYTKIIFEDLLIIYNYKNIMQLMKFSNIILHTTSKRFLLEKKNIIDTLGASILLFGQKSVCTHAHKSIAAFKLREKEIIGCMTTLRRKAMYLFLDKIILFGSRLMGSFHSKRSSLKQEKSNSRFINKSAGIKVSVTTGLNNRSGVDNFSYEKNVQSTFSTIPEYEHFFSLLDSITGFNVIYSISSDTSVPNVTFSLFQESNFVKYNRYDLKRTILFFSAFRST